MVEWRLVVRDKDGVEAATVETFSRFTAKRRVNDAGSWLLDGVPLDSIAADLLQYQDDSKGAQGILFQRDGETLFSGRVLTTTVSETDQGSTLDIVGIDDTGRLGGAYISPEPVSEPPYAADSSDDATFPTESLLYFYLGRNIVGPVTLAARRDVFPRLVGGTDSGRGTVQTKHGRLQNLLDFYQEIASVDGLIFEVLHNDETGIPTFNTRMPADRRGELVFSRDLGNVGDTTRTEDAAAVTYLLGLGKGEGADRVMAARTDDAAQARYGRFESVKDVRSAENTDQITVSLNEDLEAGRGGIAAEFDLLAASGESYGREYQLGDRVTVIAAGLEIDGYISEVTFDLGAAGATVTPSVTTTAAAPSGGRKTFSARADRRLRNLEVNAEELGAASIFGSHDLRFWWGDPGDIPAGWQVADGTNGTPDLRGFIIYGAGVQSSPAVTYTLLQGIGSNSAAVNIDINHNHASLAATATQTSPGETNSAQTATGGGTHTDAIATHTHPVTVDLPALGSTVVTTNIDTRQAGKAVWILARA